MTITIHKATSTIITLKELAGHPLPHLDPLQHFLAQNISLATSFWFAVWVMTGVVLLWKLWDEYREQKEGEKEQKRNGTY